nr:retrovirus-related Pol polyprotein from transposon TNT 1-94 [Tanacetum cinerariifolium]
MTIETHNWSSSAHQELHKVVRDENFPIVNQVDARLQNFEIQFFKEAAKFVGDFKSLANEADVSLAKHKALELEIKRLLKVVVSQDIMSIVQNESVVDTSDLQTELERNLKLLINFVWKFMGTVCFGNDHVPAILGFGDLQWGNILITRVYFVEGLGHNLFSVGQFRDSDLEVAFRRNACFVRSLKGVDLLKGDRSTNLYTINLHEMASASLICLVARALSTKSWLWHQRLSHFNFDTINDLVKNDLGAGLPKFKYHKEHLCPSCEQGKSKRASHPPKPVPNSRQRLHLLHMDLCGLIIIASISVERHNRTLVEAARTMLIFSRAPLFLWAEAIATACFTQNRSIIHRRFNKTPYELINGRKPDISFFMYSVLCVIPRMIVTILGSLVQKVILVFSLGIL